MVAGRRQHVVAYEYGAAALNAGIQFIELDDGDGMLEADDVRRARQAAEHHQPAVSLVCIENTHMAASGAPWTASGLRALVDAAGPVPIHMDGARLFNAEVATGVPAAEWAAPATTVMCCLSKGLCAPVGSLLAGDEDVIAEARLARKRLGGGMRQAGVLAAPGLVALRDMVGRLPEDHARAAPPGRGGGAALARVRTRPRLGADQHRDLHPSARRTSCWRTWRAGRAGRTPSRRNDALRDPPRCRRRRRGARRLPRAGGRAVKVRIGISAGGESLGPDAMVALGQAIAETGSTRCGCPRC